MKSVVKHFPNYSSGRGVEDGKIMKGPNYHETDLTAIATK